MLTFWRQEPSFNFALGGGVDEIGMNASTFAAQVDRLKPEDIGQKIQRMRDRCGMKQRELADMLNVSRQCIHKYEAGDAKRALYAYPLLEKIAKALSTSGLQVNVEDLIS